MNTPNEDAMISHHIHRSFFLRKSPGYFAGIAITIFVFTSMVFVVYDYLVERRQRKVYSSAVKNNAIVSSLFPKNGEFKDCALLVCHFDLPKHG